MKDTQIKNPLPTGTILKGKSYNYCIEKALGQGSFGITYLASVKMQGALGEIDSNIQLAVKEFFMKETNGRDGNTVTTGSKGGVFDKYRTKFAREAQNLSKLHHPKIVKVLESFEANNTVYYTMEYIDGGNLDNYIQKNKGLSEKESIKYLTQIGEALSYMHHNKMLHLDLKPANIVLRKNGEAVLIDFGLAKQYDDNGKPETSTSVGLGTPGYAPIEQSDYRDGKGFPMEMDVYALGATFFKMLSGVRPPDASSILNDGFPIYELQEHHVSDSLISVVAKAMAPLKKNRYQSVEEFMAALDDGGTKYDESEDTVLEFKEKDDAITLFEKGIKLYKVGEINHTEAIKWYVKKAAEQGSLMAQNYLGVCYYNGEGVAKNLSEAAKWFIKAAEQGNDCAQCNLGLCYYNGKGLKKNLSQALHWFHQAAQQCNKEAQRYMGILSYFGHACPKNYTKALAWFKKAAAQGDAEAENWIGHCYECGYGVPINLDEALIRYKKALSMGHTSSENGIKRVEEEIKSTTKTNNISQPTEEKTKDKPRWGLLTLTIIGVLSIAFCEFQNDNNNHTIAYTLAFFGGLCIMAYGGEKSKKLGIGGLILLYVPIIIYILQKLI